MKRVYFSLIICLICFGFSFICDNFMNNLPGYNGGCNISLKASAAEEDNEPIKFSNNSIKLLNRYSSVRVGDDKLYADVTCKNAGYIKKGRYMSLHVEVHNLTDSEFHGFLRVSFMEETNVMYQNEALVLPMDTTEIDVCFPAEFTDNYFAFSICTPVGKVLSSANIGINLVKHSSKIYIGILTDNYGKYEYLDKYNTDIFYMKFEDIKESVKMLDMYDCIIIDDYSLSFSVKQRRIITEWVKQGGTLVLTVPDKNASHIRAFSGDMYSTKFINESIVSKTSFGLKKENISVIKKSLHNDLKEKLIENIQRFLIDNLDTFYYKKYSKDIINYSGNGKLLSKTGEIYNKLLEKYSSQELDKTLSLSVNSDESEAIDNLTLGKVNKTITNLDIQDTMSLINENGEPIMQYKDVEFGRVLFFECGISFENDNDSMVYGTRIAELITNNISTEVKNKLQSEEYEDLNADTNKHYLKGLTKNDASSLPNLKLYTFIIVIYIIICGPVLYYVLKKKKKLMYMWLFVPIFAIAFTTFIYILGTKTRIEDSFVNYVSQMTIKSNGQSDLKTYFSYIPVDSSQETLEFDGNMDIVPFDVERESDDSTLKINDSLSLSEDYDYGIEYGKDKTSVIMNDLKFFSNRNFVNITKSKSEESYVTSINKDGDIFYGTVDNNFGYDIRNCFIYVNGYAIMIGDLAEGESISFSTNNQETRLITPNDYVYDLSNLSALCLGHSIDDKTSAYTVEEQRMKALIDAYIDSPVNSQGLFIYGFQNRTYNEFVSEIGLECNGVTAVSQNVDITYLYDSIVSLTNLSAYILNYDETVSDGIYLYMNETKSLEVTYKIPEGSELYALIYSADKNAEFNSYSSDFSYIFNGNIQAYNNKTKKKETLFESGIEKTVTDFSNYINKKDNTITLYYNIDQRIDVLGLRMPVLLTVLKNV